MSPRKPPGMSFQTFTEMQIEKARKEGLFDDLPGKGKPLPNLRDAYDPLWWAKKMVQREGVSILPPALEIRKTVEQEMKRILTLKSEAKVREAALKAQREDPVREPEQRLGPADDAACAERGRRRREVASRARSLTIPSAPQRGRAAALRSTSSCSPGISAASRSSQPRIRAVPRSFEKSIISAPRIIR
jgi:hypothetical protein